MPRQSRRRQSELALGLPRAQASVDPAEGFRVSGTRDTVAHRGASLTASDVSAWNPRRTSVDSEILPEQGRLISRARDLDRNHGVAKGGLQTLVDNVLGTGLRLNPSPDYLALGWQKKQADEWSRTVRGLFGEWFWSTKCHAGDSLTGDQISAIVFRAALLDGDAIGLPLWIPERGDGFGTKIQTIESDRLCQPPSAVPTSSTRGGIEFDQYGAPVAYHFVDPAPGDYYGAGTPQRWERVPRRTDTGRLRVLHVFDAERSGQSRGKPLLSAVLPDFKNLGRYTQAELQAAVVNALIAMTIETPLDQASILELFNGDQAAYMAAREAHSAHLSSGSVLPLFPGDKAQAFLPARPATGFDAFVTNVYRQIGVGLDLPYELILKDFSKTNYSSARAALLEAWRSFNRRREWIIATWFDPIYDLFLEEVVADGRIEAPDFYAKRAAYTRAKWIGPGRGWIDPLDEARAAELRISAGLSTFERECAEQGLDWEETFEQIATERARMKELGITLGTPAKLSEQTRAAVDGTDSTGEDDEESGDTRRDRRNREETGDTADDAAVA